MLSFFHQGSYLIYSTNFCCLNVFNSMFDFFSIDSLHYVTVVDYQVLICKDQQLIGFKPRQLSFTFSNFSLNNQVWHQVCFNFIRLIYLSYYISRRGWRAKTHTGRIANPAFVFDNWHWILILINFQFITKIVTPLLDSVYIFHMIIYINFWICPILWKYFQPSSPSLSLYSLNKYYQHFHYTTHQGFVFSRSGSSNMKQTSSLTSENSDTPTQTLYYISYYRVQSWWV